MYRDFSSIPARVLTWLRTVILHWWGGLGCRVSFLTSLTICLVIALLGSFLLWDGKRLQKEGLRREAISIGRLFASLAADHLRAGDREGLIRQLSPLFQGRDGALSGTDVISLRLYDRDSRLLVDFDQQGAAASRSDAVDPYQKPFESEAHAEVGPLFRERKDGILAVGLPVESQGVQIGFIAFEITTERAQESISGVLTRAAPVIALVLALGFVVSQVIAAGIINPVASLNSAVEEVSRQNWKSPIPVHGRDEIARLARSFNEMALTLKQRETSLSQGNRDLFLLHTAGLDLMESLDLQALLAKIAGRVEDLIKADTTTVTSVDRATRSLSYLGVQGSLARRLAARPLPLEAGGIYNWLASYGTPLLVQDGRTDFRLDGAEMDSLGVRTLLAVPLWSSNTMIAVLTVINKKGGGTFDKHDLQLLTVFSNIANAALQNAFLYADLMNKMRELTNAQQQLVHSTKMAAIGELATNVAHEINNPLTSVLGYTSHLIRTPDVPEESRQKLRMMEQETLRVRKIIRNLLDFARQRMSWKQPGDVLQPLRETIAFLQGAADRSSVRIIEEYPNAPVVVNMDHNEIKQVFINIMNNALHAMSTGGTLRISVQPVREREIRIDFRDSGHGIAEEHLGKIFEPFFSTKQYGDGTGLGLSISERIVQNHGGRIEVDSTIGVGSTFRVILPAAAAPVASGQA